MHTKETITRLLNESYDKNDHRFVERSLLALYTLQTLDERNASRTRHRNHLGFSVRTAKEGTYLGKWLATGKNLSGRFINSAYAIAQIHAGQLARIANDPELRRRVQKNIRKTPGF